MKPNTIEFSPCAFCDCSGVIEDHTGLEVIDIHACNGYRQASLRPGVSCVSFVPRQPGTESHTIGYLVRLSTIGYFINLPSRRSSKP